MKVQIYIIQAADELSQHNGELGFFPSIFGLAEHLVLWLRDHSGSPWEKVLTWRKSLSEGGFRVPAAALSIAKMEHNLKLAPRSEGPNHFCSGVPV